jgi:hypothetical protein
MSKQDPRPARPHRYYLPAWTGPGSPQSPVPVPPGERWVNGRPAEPWEADILSRAHQQSLQNSCVTLGINAENTNTHGG